MVLSTKYYLMTFGEVGFFDDLESRRLAEGSTNCVYCNRAMTFFVPGGGLQPFCLVRCIHGGALGFSMSSLELEYLSYRSRIMSLLD